MDGPAPWLRRPMLALVLLAAMGCGSGAPTVPLPPSGLPPVDPATAGTLAVHLVKDGLGTGLVQLNLAVSSLEVRVGGVWRPVPLDQAPVAADLLTCTSADPLALATGVPWPPGDNDAVRFTLDPGGASVQRPDDDQPRALAVPRRFVCAMGPPGPFSVSHGRTTDLWIVFGVDRAVQALPEDPDPDAPVAALVPAQVRGVERGRTGILLGRVVVPGPAGTPAAGVPNAVVTAQLQGDAAGPSATRAYRTVQADADGQFALDLLAMGSGTTWTAVGALGTGTPAHDAALGSPSGSLGSGPPYDTLQCRIETRAALATGALSGTAPAPGTGAGLWVDLVQVFPLEAGSGASAPFLVASAPVAADGGFSFGSGLPVGYYRAVLRRFAQGPGLDLVESTRESQSFALTAGAELKLAF